MRLKGGPRLVGRLTKRTIAKHLIDALGVTDGSGLLQLGLEMADSQIDAANGVRREGSDMKMPSRHCGVR